MTTTLTLESLTTLVKGDAVAIRGKATLQPAGGPSDKIFPPTHSVDEKKEKSRYAFETRRIDGKDIDCVLLDSVQSQANRMEESLQALWADKEITLPVIAVDFAQFPDIGRVTSLTAPHRIADALLRDSLIDENGKPTLFRLSKLGSSFTDATPKAATELFRVCPTALVFGVWDSTGPKGGLGSKFARAIVSEIVGIGVARGVKTASRIDPTAIVTKAATLYTAKDPNEGWTHDPSLAATEKKEPLKFKKEGKVSEANHSNIPPTIDTLAGGVSIDRAEHTVVLSIACLRKLGFGGGDADLNARTALVALGLLAALAAEARGHDLRSRCLLVPQQGKALSLAVVDRRGNEQPLALDLAGAIKLFEAAVAALPETVRFHAKKGEPLATLKPSTKLVHLVAESRKLAAAGADIDEDE